jgi:Bifunctional DNA primase/polymerase, N-terminal
MTEPMLEPPPQLQAALEYAARGIAVVASHFPVPTSGADPSRSPGLTCSCGTADCQRPARHPIWTSELGEATLDTIQLVGWWLGMPGANVATPAGASFDLVELGHPAPTGRIIRWLAMHGIGCGPVISAGRGNHQFLVSTGWEGWDFSMTEHGGLARGGRDGGLILLPPSRVTGGATARWVRPLDCVPLPDGELVYDALAGLPGRGELASAVA